MSWYKKALVEDHIDKVLKHFDNPRDLPFNNIFGDKYRISFPLINRELLDIVEKLETGETKTSNKYIINLETQTANKIINKNDKEVIDPRALRLGKIISRELGKEYADEWSRQVAGKSEEDYSIIMSRHPIDVARMSDHYNWSSCHSPKGKNPTGYDAFPSAIAEAIEGGPIAYAVKTSDLNGIDLNEEEIFYDYDRSIDGIEPASRLRLRRFRHNEDDYELAVPEISYYGNNIAGFEKAVTKWAYNKQKPEFEGKDIDLYDFEYFGGAYKDNSDGNLFNSFFNSREFHNNTEYGGEAQAQSQGEIWEEELTTILERNSDLEYSSIHASVEDDFIYCSSSITFTFQGAITENFEEDYWNLQDKIIGIANEIFNEFYVGDCEINWSEDRVLELLFNLECDNLYNPDDITDLFRALESYEYDGYKDDWHSLKNELEELGVLQASSFEKSIKSFYDTPFKNLMIDKKESNNTNYLITSKPIINIEYALPYSQEADFRTKIEIELEEAMKAVYSHIASQPFLFPELEETIDINKLPRPRIVKRHYEISDRQFGQGIVRSSSSYGIEFDISIFDISRMDLTSETADGILRYITTFDENFNEIHEYIKRKVAPIYKEYYDEVNHMKKQEEQEKMEKAQQEKMEKAQQEKEIIASNWYKTYKEY